MRTTPLRHAPTRRRRRIRAPRSGRCRPRAAVLPCSRHSPVARVRSARPRRAGSPPPAHRHPLPAPRSGRPPGRRPPPRWWGACRGLCNRGHKPCHARVKVRSDAGSMGWVRDFLSATRERVLIYDGGMGATLEQFDLSLEDDYRLPGRCHEALVLNRPDVIEGVHASMLEAGAVVLETDTFQGSRLKLSEWGLEDHTHEINLKAAQIARNAAGEQRFVAGSIGPTGFLPASDDASLGQIRFRELVEVFTEQARALVEGGVDLIIIETAQDILEVKAAVFGAREAFKELGRAVPIQCSVSLL